MPSQGKIVEAILNMDEVTTLRLVEEMISSGVDPVEILEECRSGMSAVGMRFENGQMYLSELFMASEIFGQVMKRIKPLLARSPNTTTGKVVIGTVEGDVHDIGKNIFVALLEAEGYEVIDLGVDVPPTKFVQAITQHKPSIVGMSSLLSTSLESVKKTIDAISEAGLRKNVKIIVGGGRIDRQAAEYFQPDAFSDNASHGVKQCKELLGEA